MTSLELWTVAMAAIGSLLCVYSEEEESRHPEMFKHSGDAETHVVSRHWRHSPPRVIITPSRSVPLGGNGLADQERDMEGTGVWGYWCSQAAPAPGQQERWGARLATMSTAAGDRPGAGHPRGWLHTSARRLLREQGKRRAPKSHWSRQTLKSMQTHHLWGHHRHPVGRVFQGGSAEPSPRREGDW